MNAVKINLEALRNRQDKNPSEIDTFRYSQREGFAVNLQDQGGTLLKMKPGPPVSRTIGGVPRLKVIGK